MAISFASKTLLEDRRLAKGGTGVHASIPDQAMVAEVVRLEGTAKRENNRTEFAVSCSFRNRHAFDFNLGIKAVDLSYS